MAGTPPQPSPGLEQQEAGEGASPSSYSPPARRRRRCASGPPRRSRSHGGPLLHAPEPGGQVWARPMGPPAPRPAAPGRLRARGPCAPSAAPLPGAPEQAGSAAGAPRAPAPGPWSQESRRRARPCLALFLLLPKRKKKRGVGGGGEIIKLLEAGCWRSREAERGRVRARGGRWKLPPRRPGGGEEKEGFGGNEGDLKSRPAVALHLLSSPRRAALCCPMLPPAGRSRARSLGRPTTARQTPPPPPPAPQ